MESYSQEISVKRSKSSLVSILADPYRFAGITGHLVFYTVFDKEKGNFVPEGTQSPQSTSSERYSFLKTTRVN
ncbi:MAG: hypothetical protein TQ35_0003210 [Candidatus Aramenus sulfurataquae]|jgi:hypothetical protein|uniref:Uncharacterized protein n=2 Tax=Candidatus Aramenus sulfurataquae TaxID=1326980 RepID=A0AAE3K335_9CREN|nr:hypothetical protein [Candidatus Aramenus sulfurataquae]